MNVSENISFGLKAKKPCPHNREIRHRVAEALSLFGLSGLEKRYPYQLSGRQQQLFKKENF